MAAVLPGMFLIKIPGMVNVMGPQAEFDNKIVRITYDGSRDRVLAQVGGARYPTHTLDEVKRDLTGWKYIREIPNVDDSKQVDFSKEDGS